jgi:predicted nucleic acid-binding Zn ribbon protein
MVFAPRNRSRRQGSVTVLLPAAAAPAQAVGPLLEELQRQWQSDGHLAALWQAWPRIAGPQLAQHCRPLRLQNGRLTVGASHPQWLQALRFSRHQLLAALRAAGFALHDLQIQQHQAAPLPPAASELEQASWRRHPCRVDVHGMGCCDRCLRPAPAGELQRWGHCSFCQRERMAAGAEPQ